MHSFFTDIFINGLPVNYGISYKEGYYQFEPVFNPHDHLFAPQFAIMKSGEAWDVTGTDDSSVVDQAIEIVQGHYPQS